MVFIEFYETKSSALYQGGTLITKKNHNSIRLYQNYGSYLAEKGRFELPRRFKPAYTLSRGASSANLSTSPYSASRRLHKLAESIIPYFLPFVNSFFGILAIFFAAFPISRLWGGDDYRRRNFFRYAVRRSRAHTFFMGRISIVISSMA